MAAQIPIRNIYQLLCYAWSRLDEGEIVSLAADDSNNTCQLLARILIIGVQRILKEGLDRSYFPLNEDSRVLRGRLEFSETLKRQLLPTARAHMQFDELSENNTLNQIIKSTLLRLAQLDELSHAMQGDLLHLARRFSNVSPIHLSPAIFHQVQIHRHNAFYGLVIDVCELVYFSTFVNEEEGPHQFRDFVRDENRMWQVFQDFITNFYRIHYPMSRVRSEQVLWDIDSDSPDKAELLPRMITDIVIRETGRVIVIDTKYYKEALSKHRGNEAARSAHLYQLFSYLGNIESKLPHATALGGVLLYPTVEYEVHKRYRVKGHSLMLATVNLSQQWSDIEKRLHLIYQQAA